MLIKVLMKQVCDNAVEKQLPNPSRWVEVTGFQSKSSL